MRRHLVRAGVALSERGLPDPVVRAGIRRTVATRLAAESARSDAQRNAMLESWHHGPIALVPDTANDQHYELPARFFELVLGPRLKYSACWWPDDVSSLAAAEEAMLDLTLERAGIEDGMRVLDLGCGWGSASLRIAERFPTCSVVAVSNSSSQGDFLRQRASSMNLTNVAHQVADVNRLELEGRFDAVLSVEMLEHVRNHPRLLEQLAEATTSGAPIFVHVFAHRNLFWEFEDRGPGDWMARTFFSGGIMPSHDEFARLVAPFEVETSWWIDGTHYQRTLEAWLRQLDQSRPQVQDVLHGVYGPNARRWLQRWRMFFMACAEFFGYADGGLLGVSHHRLRLK